MGLLSPIGLFLYLAALLVPFFLAGYYLKSNLLRGVIFLLLFAPHIYLYLTSAPLKGGVNLHGAIIMDMIYIFTQKGPLGVYTSGIALAEIYKRKSYGVMLRAVLFVVVPIAFVLASFMVPSAPRNSVGYSYKNQAHCDYPLTAHVCYGRDVVLDYMQRPNQRMLK